MTDAELVAFLQWALPRRRMRWKGFRKVRGQVKKRVARRLRELGLELGEYRAYLDGHPDEWGVLDGLCRIPISRFCRDRAVWEELRDLLPRWPQPVACWSAGCASGEEPYTLAIVARRVGADVTILATDADPHLLERARAATYEESSLKELPAAWREEAFDGPVLKPAFRTPVTLLQQDIRRAMPDGPFHVIFCRYLAFTYFDDGLQREIAAGLRARLAPGGRIFLGRHETMPA